MSVPECRAKEAGKITELHPSDDFWNYITIRYDDGTKNKNMDGGWLRFTNYLTRAPHGRCQVGFP